jgi:hypothetical protein
LEKKILVFLCFEILGCYTHKHFSSSSLKTMVLWLSPFFLRASSLVRTARCWLRGLGGEQPFAIDVRPIQCVFPLILRLWARIMRPPPSPMKPPLKIMA